MMGGGNILVLQRILGHSDIRVTMRYAHFAPDHLEDAIYLKPAAENKNRVHKLTTRGQQRGYRVEQGQG